MLPEAIELLLLYYRKRPDLFEQIYSGFVSVFGVDKSIYDYGYFTPKTAVEQHVLQLYNDITNLLRVA